MICKRMNSSSSTEMCSIMDFLKNTNTKNTDFLKHLKDVIEKYKNSGENYSIFIDILPLIINRFTRIYDDNFSLSETTDDDVIIIIMRENLQAAFSLAENCQEILNLICEQQLIYFTSIKRVFKHLLECVILFLKHWECSSKLYKDLFYDEISKLSEVLKHLYLIVLNTIETSITLNENEENEQELADILHKISDMSGFFFNLDIKVVVCTWKAFGAIAAKYSELLQVTLDISTPIQCLIKIVYEIFQSINSGNEDIGKGPIKILGFLMKVLYKLSDIFYQKINIFSKELVLLFVEVFNITESTVLKYYIQDEIYNNLEVFLLHLIMGESLFKVELCDILKFSDVGTKTIGILNLFNTIFKIICKQSDDCSDIIAKALEVVFRVLPNAYEELLWEDNTLYHGLIINMSAAILLQDKTTFSITILVKNIANADPMCAFLALEVFTLISRNISEDEAFFLLINILYSLNDLQCGSFTPRPDMLYFKCLLHRMFHGISNTSRDQVVKQFCTPNYEKVWRYLEFSLLNINQVSQLMKPALQKVDTSINNLHSECSKDSSVYIADCLDLLSTAQLSPNTLEMSTIIKFVNTFWDLDLSQNHVIGNHFFQFFMRKICRITISLLKSHTLNPQVIFDKMTQLSCCKKYWTIVYRIIDELLCFISSTCLKDSYNQQLMKNISDIISLVLRDTTKDIIKQNYFEMFKNLNRTHREVLNTILDTLNSNIAHKIYQTIENNSINSNIKERSSFQHKCLIWNQNVTVDNINPKMKKPKLEEMQVKCINFPRLYPGNKENNSVITMEVDEESSASEVINRLKDEVKCLLRLTKTEKLSAKNIADLKMLTSQINSVMI